MKILFSLIVSMFLASPAIAQTRTLMVSIDRRPVPPAKLEIAKQALLTMGCPARITNYIPYDRAPYYGVVFLEIPASCFGTAVQAITRDGRYTVYSNTPIQPLNAGERLQMQ